MRKELKKLEEWRRWYSLNAAYLKYAFPLLKKDQYAAASN